MEYIGARVVCDVLVDTQVAIIASWAEILCANRPSQYSEFVKSSGSESCALEISYATV